MAVIFLEPSTIALLILLVTIILFVTELLPIPVTAVSSALAMGIFGVIPFSTAFSGFSNDVTIMVIGAMIVGEALFETGVADKLGNSIVRMVGSNERAFLIVCILVSAILSAFLSNAAVVAMMLPLVSATAERSNGKIKKKNIYMAVGFAANIGGGMTLVGSTPNVIGQGLLEEAGLAPMGFFDLTLGSLPRLLFIVVYYATIGYALQKKVFTFEEPGAPIQAPTITGTMVRSDPNDELHPKRAHTKAKMVISVGIMVFLVVGFISGIFTVGAVALLAGLACVWTRCISIRQVYERLDWTTVWVLAGSLGMAAGIDQSGAGELIANAVLACFGGSISHLSLLIIFTLLATVMGNFMSSSASTAILGPIALSICQAMGYPGKPVMMAIIWSLNLAFLTPIATPPITMTLQGGYRFLDYAKLGAPLLVGSLLLTILCYPVIFDL